MIVPIADGTQFPMTPASIVKLLSPAASIIGTDLPEVTSASLSLSMVVDVVFLGENSFPAPIEVFTNSTV